MVYDVAGALPAANVQLIVASLPAGTGVAEARTGHSSICFPDIAKILGTGEVGPVEVLVISIDVTALVWFSANTGMSI
jgi:hypothetical protein